MSQFNPTQLWWEIWKVLTRPGKVKKTCMAWARGWLKFVSTQRMLREFKVSTVESSGFCNQNCIMPCTLFLFISRCPQSVPKEYPERAINGFLGMTHYKQQTHHCHQASDYKLFQLLPKNQIWGVRGEREGSHIFILHTCQKSLNKKILGWQYFFFNFSSLRSFLPFCQKPQGRTSVKSK